MISIAAPALYALAGVTVGAMAPSLARLWVANGSDPLHLTFAGMCLAIAAAAGFNGEMLQAQSGAVFLQDLALNIDALLGVQMTFAWFMRAYADRPSRLWPWVVTLLGAGLIAANHLLAGTLQFARFDGIRGVHLPWQETITFGVGAKSPWAAFAGAVIIANFAYALSLLRHSRGRPRRAGQQWMMASVLLFLLVTAEGMAGRLAGLDWVPFGPLGMVITILVMSASLAFESRQRLISSEANLRALFENSPAAMFAVDWSDGRIVSANPAALAMTGYLSGELLSKTLSEITADAESPRVRLRFAELFEGKSERLRLERSLVRKDGSVLQVDTSLSTLKDKNGHLFGLMVSATDITERKAFENRLRESEARLRTVIEHSPIAISFSRAGVTLDVNARFLEMYGYDEVAELRGTPALHHIAPAARPEIEQRIDQRAEDGDTPTSYETLGQRKDGSEFPIFVSVNTVELADGMTTLAYIIDFTDQRAFEDKIRHLAFFDQLTRLPNRQFLHEKLDASVRASEASGRQGALLLIDLDNFKTVNDTLGHAAGDLLLREVAERLQRRIRPSDTLARLGGDEFVIVLEDLADHEAGAAAAAEAMGSQLMRLIDEPSTINTHEIRNTCSIGVTTFARRGSSVEDLLKQADIAMYHAKRSGRHAMQVFAPAMQAEIVGRAELEAELRRAVDFFQFELHYQIQVDEAGRTLGAEALVRWKHPERGLQAPGLFIPLAEETGLILPIGRWALGVACGQLRAWQDDPRTCDLTLAVNVSPLQFHQPNFADEVREVIARHQIDPGRLKLELTESMLQQDIQRTIRTMAELRRDGVQFSLDDFGTGYSSLQYIKQLPLNQLKIDQSFVRDIATDPNDRAIVQTIIAMAGSLGLDVIAEGVETPEQLALLTACGCRRYQGYLIGRPVPVQDLHLTD